LHLPHGIGFGSEIIAHERTFYAENQKFPEKQERLKKCCGRSAARNFGVLAWLSEEACPKRPVTERKRSRNPKGPLRLPSKPNGHSISENALITDTITI
jgi:hypothetical protein